VRVGIIGVGPFSIEISSRIVELGGSVVLFAEKSLALERDLLLRVADKDNLDFATFYKNVLEQKINTIREACDVREFSDIVRIQKRLLHKHENFEGRSRLADLFRIVYTLDPTENVLKQVDENPEVFSQLGDDVLHSLKERVELSEDVDIIIDGREELFYPRYSGVDGQPLLNEQKWEESILRGALANIKLDGRVLLSIDSEEAAKYLEPILLKSWDDIRHLTVLSKKDWLPNLEQVNQKKWDSDIENFHQKMNAWKSLEEYEKVRVPKPAEPSKKLIFFPELRAMSLDKLLDREEYFITAEEFVPDSEELKTFGVKHFMSYHFSKAKEKVEREEEPGYFHVTDTFLQEGNYSFRLVENRSNEIIDRLMNYFSKA
jgi:hypothetical protein